MKTLSKRLTLEQGKVTKELYDPKEAISLLKSTSSAKFDESMEAHISLAIDPKYSDQQLRTTVVLPNGTGKSIRIAVLCSGEKVTEAEQAGAGGSQLLSGSLLGLRLVGGPPRGKLAALPAGGLRLLGALVRPPQRVPGAALRRAARHLQAPLAADAARHVLLWVDGLQHRSVDVERAG